MSQLNDEQSPLNVNISEDLTAAEALALLPIGERKTANAIRVLAMDAVEHAKSGHPGAPMGMADIADVVWREFLSHNPNNPHWANRDRFVLSNGHGSMLLYALLHLTGYDLSLEDLREFRKLHSKTPGHPEYGYTPGVETTTGPLGQGLANAVGFALAEKTLAAQFNCADFAIIDHFTYCFLGDGCLMEGISHEVCSLAGTLKLSKLICYYDDNGISIDGEVSGWFSDDTAKRFDAYGWQVLRVDGHNASQIRAATKKAKASDRPTLIVCKTTIGLGSPNKQGKESSHGSPLGAEEIVLVREALQWTSQAFELTEDIYALWDAKAQGDKAEKAWLAKFEAYKNAYPDEAFELQRRLQGELPDDFVGQMDEFIQSVRQKGEHIATRKASQNAIAFFAPLLPEILGGSADLAGSNLTLWQSARGVQTHADGNYVYYGVREFGMTAIANGVALHGGFIPYTATFLMFMEYAKNAVRMAALMGQRVIQVYTHDSIGLGEDGPTHQPVEQIASLRHTPNMHVWRPCDAVETAVAWKMALLNKTTPTALILSRQNLAPQSYDDTQLKAIEQGGYILAKEKGKLKAIIIATGSEVQLAMTAYQKLDGVRVVSMPCAEMFCQQDNDYRESVLPSGVRARVAIEAAIADYWYKFVGLDGKIIAMNSFGESAPAKDLFHHFGFTVDKVVDAVQSLM